MGVMSWVGVVGRVGWIGLSQYQTGLFPAVKDHHIFAFYYYQLWET